MKAQTLALCLPYEGCDKDCPYCVSKMTWAPKVDRSVLIGLRLPCRYADLISDHCKVLASCYRACRHSVVGRLKDHLIMKSDCVICQRSALLIHKSHVQVVGPSPYHIRPIFRHIDLLKAYRSVLLSNPNYVGSSLKLEQIDVPCLIHSISRRYTLFQIEYCEIQVSQTSLIL